MEEEEQEYFLRSVGRFLRRKEKKKEKSGEERKKKKSGEERRGEERRGEERRGEWKTAFLLTFFVSRVSLMKRVTLHAPVQACRSPVRHGPEVSSQQQQLLHRVPPPVLTGLHTISSRSSDSQHLVNGNHPRQIRSLPARQLTCWPCCCCPSSPLLSSRLLSSLSSFCSALLCSSALTSRGFLSPAPARHEQLKESKRLTSSLIELALPSRASPCSEFQGIVKSVVSH
eukprot:753689-Hanusia_phi.AAC.2